MIVINELIQLQQRQKPIVLAAGFFDGVHRGHQKVLQAALAAAEKIQGEAWVMTFDPHPMKILRPERAPLILTSTPHKLELLKAFGIQGCIVLPFSRELAATPPDEFANWLFHCAPMLKHVVVGDNWRFGAKAAGTPAMLGELGQAAGVTVEPICHVMDGDDPISSTRIRQAITTGNLAEAALMLGRPPSVLGTVIHGRAIGRTLGYPSANLDPHNEALPPLGVYAVQARVNNQFYAGALNFGTRPTFDKDKAVPPLLELHLLDFNETIYDNDVEAFFIKHLRDEWYFATIDELKQQIAEDIKETREAITQNGMSSTLIQFLTHTP